MTSTDEDTRELPQGVVIVLRHEGRYLFAKRGPAESMPGRWCFVAGQIEPGEDPVDTVAREAREEVDVEVRAVRKLREGMSEGGAFFLHYWLAELVSGEARVASDEVAGVAWVDLEGARALPDHFDEDIEIIEALEAELAR